MFLRLWQGGVRRVAELAIRMQVSERTAARRLSEFRAGKLEQFKRNLDIETGEETDEEVAARPLPPDPGPDFDHLAVARRIAASKQASDKDKLNAIATIEKRRCFDLLNGTEKGQINWRLLELDDIPVSERARLFGLLAPTMLAARAPFMVQAETSQAQQAVYLTLGVQAHAEDAEAILAALGPARAEALARAAILAAARSGPPPDMTPVDPQDYLDHVPEAAVARSDPAMDELRARVRRLTVRPEAG